MFACDPHKKLPIVSVSVDAAGTVSGPPSIKGVDGPREDTRGGRKIRKGFRRRSNGAYRDFARRELKELACGQLDGSGDDSFGIIRGLLSDRETC